MPIQRIHPAARYSDAVIHNSTLYLVEVPQGQDVRIGVQTEEVLISLERQLKACGSDKSRILMATIYLVDIAADYDVMNAVWEKWLPAGCAPVRACVEVKRLAQTDWRIEIAMTAAV